MNDIPGDWGTAVNVQAMVFGNMGETSGTGVAFTRNPSTGEKKLFGEYLLNAQGEDVVAGIRTPEPISHLQEQMPDVYEQFVEIADTPGSITTATCRTWSITIERGKLYMLQTRNGKRTAAAALKIAVDLVDEGMISEEEAVLKVEPKQLDSLLHPSFDAAALEGRDRYRQGSARLSRRCLPAASTSPPTRRPSMARTGQKVILVRLETTPEDIEGMDVARRAS